MSMNFNLLEEKWIPVLYRDGRWDRVGIRKALEDAGRIRQIAASNPMDRVAILRFLLALLYWCKGNPPEGASSNLDDSFPSDWFKKLDQNKDCFNLLGDGKRFYQCNPANNKKKHSANYLIQEVPTGTNLWHFRHSTDGNNGLCPACCAIGLLRLPLFATSGGKGKSPGINAKPPIYVIPVGKSLAAILRLSWRQISSLGTAAWEKPDLELPKAGEVLLLMGLTWLPRRVLLDNPEEPEANCISCGSKERLIRFTVFAGIGSTKTTEGGSGRKWRDPHVIYEKNKKGDNISLPASDALGAPDAAAGNWAKITAGSLKQQKANDSHKLWGVGFATVKNDKYLEAIEYEIPFFKKSDDHKIQETIEKIERWQKEGLNLAKRIRPKKSSKKHVEINSMVDAIRPHVEGRVSKKVGESLSRGDAAWEDAAREYGPMMEMIAQSLSPGFTTAALQRRQKIARITPDMRPKLEAEKKSGRKKGGDK